MAKKKTKKGEILAAVGDFLSTFLTTLVVLVALAIIVVRLLGWNMYSVDSYSMTPTYPINSLVIVKPVEPETIQVGDVITYVLNEDGVLVTHRVTEISRANETFTTKGDANEAEDASPVLWANVVGKVVIGFPAIGAVLRVLTEEENRPFVIAGIVLLLVFAFGWDIVSRLLGKDKEKIEKTAKLPKEDSPDEGHGSPKSPPDGPSNPPDKPKKSQKIEGSLDIEDILREFGSGASDESDNWK